MYVVQIYVSRSFHTITGGFAIRPTQWCLRCLVVFLLSLQFMFCTLKPPSTPATMSKQHCRTLQYKVERCFDIVAGVDRA